MRNQQAAITHAHEKPRLELVGAVGGITQGVARILGLSKSARLRRAISDDLKLYASLGKDDGELKQPAVHLAGLVELHTRQLYLREVIAANRTYDWSQPILGIALAAICALPVYLMFLPDALWKWITSGVRAVLVLTLVAAGLSGFRKQPTLEELAAAAEQAEADTSSPPGG